MLIVCRECGTEVEEGPRGGYVCGLCFHTVTPEEMPTATRGRSVAGVDGRGSGAGVRTVRDPS
jgi:hypothetical protein